MKRVLIISPYFPPVNAADMQRIRMSLPYFKDFEWEAEVVTVDPRFTDMTQDPLLLKSLPADLPVHHVKAFDKSFTSKFGLGSIGIRSLWFYKRKVSQLLRHKTFDLIYFSTTQFPVCILGAFWKKKFNVPYVIDMQDPWHSDYYRDKPKHLQPPKYWFSYRLNKYLEPIAMQSVSGLISVSDSYTQVLDGRYPAIKTIPSATVTFGAFHKDLEIVAEVKDLPLLFSKSAGVKNLVYIGRGGSDMAPALNIFFNAFKKGLEEKPEVFKSFRLHFIGTSYAPAGQGVKTIIPIAKQFGLQDYVDEHTDRVPLYQGLYNLSCADGLLIPGSDDAAYTASKIYPYILTEKPLLGIFHEASSVVSIVRDCNAGEIISLQEAPDKAYKKVESYLAGILAGEKPRTDWKAFKPYTAREMTRKQCELFDEVLSFTNKI